MKNIEEAAEELELITDENVQFQIGEIFLFQDMESTQV